MALAALTLRMRGIFFSIATIALAIIIETVVMNWRFVGGAAGIQIQRPPVMAPFDSYVKMLFFVQAVLVLNNGPLLTIPANHPLIPDDLLSTMGMVLVVE